MKNSTLAFEKVPNKTTDRGVRFRAFKNVKTVSIGCRAQRKNEKSPPPAPPAPSAISKLEAELEEQFLLKNQSQNDAPIFGNHGCGRKILHL